MSEEIPKYEEERYWNAFNQFEATMYNTYGKTKAIEVLSNNITNYVSHLQQKVEQLEKENQKFFEELNTCMIERNSFLDKAEQLENIRKEAIEEINHELKGHILLNDEESWNDEFYTNGKLDYKKLLIALLTNLLNILNKGSDKE